MNQSSILSKIWDTYPFPTSQEVGFSIHLTKVGKLEQGKEGEVLINDLDGSEGDFHTHPLRSLSEFSNDDIKINIEYNHKFAYVGHDNEVSFINFTNLPKKVMNMIDSYKSRKNKGLLSKITCEMNDRREFFYNE